MYIYTVSFDDMTISNFAEMFNFYCTMHYSTKRGIVIACCLSVHPSACLCVCNVGGLDCDHIGWKSWKLIARSISPTPSRFKAQRPSTYF